MYYVQLAHITLISQCELLAAETTLKVNLPNEALFATDTYTAR